MEYKDIFEAISLAKAGDQNAREYVVTRNMGLVFSIVRKFLNRGCDADDLFQIGCIGLVKAMDKFDINFDVKFSTYAVPMIMGEIKRHLRDDGMLKVSRNLKEISIRAKYAMDKLSKNLGREATVKEIATEIGENTEDVVMALDATNIPESINMVVTEDGKELGDIIDDGVDTEQCIVDRLLIKDALSNLSARERQIIIMRYFKDKTQSQIANMLGISQVQVSRIEKKVLLKMRDKMTG